MRLLQSLPHSQPILQDHHDEKECTTVLGMCLQQVSEAVNFCHFAFSAAFSLSWFIKINLNQTSFLRLNIAVFP